MRRLTFVFVVIIGLIPIIAYSQVPEQLNYQAVIKDGSGELVADKDVTIKISILANSMDGDLLYSETYLVKTTKTGVVNIKIGSGTPEFGTFGSINWETGTKYLKTEIDIEDIFVDVGTVQLVSVPYALFAKDVADKNDADADSTNEIQNLNMNGNVLSITNNPDAIQIDLAPYQGVNTDNQELNLSGTNLSITGGNNIDVSSLVNDADADPANELQLMYISNDTIFLENGGAIKLPPDQIEDADSDPVNELQNLTLTGDTLKISNGNDVVLPYDSSQWGNAGADLYYTKGKVGIGVINPNSKLEVKADASFTETDTLFSVKDKNGNVVFAVFPDGAKVYVNEGSKGSVGGFAVTGRNPTKAPLPEEEYLRVTPDSTRIWVTEDATKGRVGGFAVTGRNPTKGMSGDYLVITSDSARIYINDTTTTKGRVGGFAVTGRNPTKGANDDYLRVTRDSTRVYITDGGVKGRVGGFAVTGRNPTKSVENDYFNILGTTTAEQILNESRVMWYPEKSALLAGELYVPDPDSVGEFSLSLGYRNMAKGKWSQAMGYQSIARGTYSTAIGYEAIADSSSFAFGTGSKALGINSFAFGTRGVDISGNPLTTTTTATGDYSFAFGMGSSAIGTGSFVLGANCEASGDFSTAAGFGTIASGLNSTAFGINNSSEGEVSFTMGSNNTAVGQYSIALGANNLANGTASVALGLGNTAGNYAIVGGNNNVANGVGSFAVGSGNSASGDGSIAAGTGNECTQTYSAAFGSGNTTTGSTAFASGYGTTSGGVASFATGYETTAGGDYSLTAGYQTSTSVGGAFATGTGSSATGVNSIAAGYYTTAQSYASLVIGRYNTLSGTTGSWSSGDPLFVIGNGTSTNPTFRNDAFVVYKNGNAKIDGNFYPDDHGSKNLGISGTNSWNVVYATGGVSTASDKRLKSEISTLKYGLDDLLKLRPITYLWKDKPEQGIKIGLIAQELQPVINEIVDIGNDENRTLSVRYTELIPVLIKGIQEQQKIIEEQNSKNKVLENQIEELNERLKRIEEKLK